MMLRNKMVKNEGVKNVALLVDSSTHRLSSMTNTDALYESPSVQGPNEDFFSNLLVVEPGYEIVSRDDARILDVRPVGGAS